MVDVHDELRVDSPELDLGLMPAGFERGHDGTYLLSGCSLPDLAARFGTPALLIDEEALRARAGEYLRAFRSRHADSLVYFATKAFPSASILRVLAEEGLGFDVASGNELAIARAAGIESDRMLLHGNAKTGTELTQALSCGLGYIVIDNLDDVERLARLATAPCRVLLRITPGIGAHTHAANATGQSGSKFGVSLQQAPEVIDEIRSVPNLILDGLHAHIGSQIFDTDQFRQEVEALASLPPFKVYDFGGGLATRYVSADPTVTIDDYAKVLVGAAHRYLPAGIRIMVEPGRSMVGAMGISLYRVVTVKRGTRTHVAVDGGMGDNLEVSLYGQRFQPWLLTDQDRPLERCDLVGHHCESGDVLAHDALMLRARVGDLAIVPATGAYTFTMSNNYNGALRPPVILCRNGKSRVGVRRETLSDLLVRETTVDAAQWA